MIDMCEKSLSRKSGYPALSTVMGSMYVTSWTHVQAPKGSSGAVDWSLDHQLPWLLCC